MRVEWYFFFDKIKLLLLIDKPQSGEILIAIFIQSKHKLR